MLLRPLLMAVLLLWAADVYAQAQVVTRPESIETTFSTTTAQAVATTDAQYFRCASVHIVTQGGSSTVTFQASGDNSNWVSTALVLSTNTGAFTPATSTTSASVIYTGPIHSRYFRLNVTGIASGTTAGVVHFNSGPCAEFTIGASVSVVSNLTPGTGATNLGKAEDAGHTTGDTGVFSLGVRNESTTQITSADLDYSPQSVDAYGDQFVRVDHQNRIHCFVAASTATTIQAVGTSCVAPGAGLSIYITDIHFAYSAAAGVAADSFPTLKYGTGGTCGTGTTVFWGSLNITVTGPAPAIQSFKTPVKIPANNEVCWIMSTAATKVITIDGFIAP